MLKYSYRLLSIILLAILGSNSFGQPLKDSKGVFVVPKSEYWEEIQVKVKQFLETPKPAAKSFKMDFSGLDLPKAKEEFDFKWHNDPVNQGITGTCWSYSTTSFFESEIYRLHKVKIRLSPIYTAYFEYLEKAKRFVEKRGNSTFGEGSQGNAVRRLWEKYGIVPVEAYSGRLQGQEVNDHSKMFEEMKVFLNQIKESNQWSEELVYSTIKSILNHYLGTPPSTFNFEGKEYSPLEFFKNVVKLNMNDYVDVISLKQEPYFTKIIYNVPDNWWINSDYHNLPLDDFMAVIKKGIKDKYTFAIAGDVSEPGIDSHAKVAMVPTFDIPAENINEDSRQFRFSNGTTTDDHGVHLLGYKTINKKDWFLIKDSGAGSFNVGDKGYYFLHEDYLKLKILAFMVHKDALGDLMNN